MNQKLLKAKMIDLKNYLKNHRDIATVYLFGSYGTLLYDPELSDIDLAIIFSRGLTLKEEMLVDAEISVILESDNLDVVNLSKARVDICYKVLATGTIIYERNNILTADFVEKTLKHYFDHGLALEKMKEDTVEVIKENSSILIGTTKVLAKIRLIKENLAKLVKLKEAPEEVFKKDFEKYDSAKYSLQTSIEAMVDICNHIISRKCLGMPKTKADSFIILCQNNILSPDMQETYSAMARFRNRVVHLYDEVDTADVYQYVNEGISDFNRFVDDVNKYLTREED